MVAAWIWRPCFAAYGWLLLLLLSASRCPAANAASAWREALEQFSPANDVPAQRDALLSLLESNGRWSRLHVNDQSYVVGSPGLYAWDTPNTSYCAWWGVNCCGAT
jgi:hypothetical protein